MSAKAALAAFESDLPWLDEWNLMDAASSFPVGRYQTPKTFMCRRITSLKVFLWEFETSTAETVLQIIRTVTFCSWQVLRNAESVTLTAKDHYVRGSENMMVTHPRNTRDFQIYYWCKAKADVWRQSMHSWIRKTKAWRYWGGHSQWQALPLTITDIKHCQHIVASSMTRCTTSRNWINSSKVNVR